MAASTNQGERSVSKKATAAIAAAALVTGLVVGACAAVRVESHLQDLIVDANLAGDSADDARAALKVLALLHDRKDDAALENLETRLDTDVVTLAVIHSDSDIVRRTARGAIAEIKQYRDQHPRAYPSASTQKRVEAAFHSLETPAPAQ